MSDSAFFLILIGAIALAGIYGDHRRRRFYHEFLCRRGAHEMIVERENAYRWPSTHRAWPTFGVADRTVETRLRCRHCGEATTWKIMVCDPLNGLSLNSDRWDQLKQEGRIKR